MSNFYLTDLPAESPSRKSPKCKAKQEEIKNVQSEYLNFLMKQESRFADLKSIESFHKQELHHKSLQFNTNKDILLKKTAEYQSILNTIENELKLNYRVTNDDILLYYNTEISSFRQLIKEKDHDKKAYQNMYNRLYHCNFMIKKRIETEIVYEEMNLKQISQYIIINNNALLTMKQKQEMLNQMKKYKEKYEIKNCDELYDKEKQSNFLQYQVEVIKKDSLFLEKKLKKFYDKSQEVMNEANRIGHINRLNYNDYLGMKRDYYRVHVQLMTILKQLNAKKLDKFIFQIREKRVEYHNFISTFHYYNEEVIKANEVLHRLNDKLSDLNRQIEEKAQEEKSYDNQLTQKTISKKEQNSYICSQLRALIKKRVCFMQNLLYFLSTTSKTLIKRDNEAINDCKNKLVKDILVNDIQANKPFIISLDSLNDDSIKVIFRLFHWFISHLLVCYFNELTLRRNSDDPFNLLSNNTNNSNYNDDGNEERHSTSKSLIDIIDIKASLYQSPDKPHPIYHQPLTPTSNRRLTPPEHSKEIFTTISTQAYTKIKACPEGKITTQEAMLQKFFAYLNDTKQLDYDNGKQPIEDIDTAMCKELSLNSTSNKDIFNRNSKRLTALFSKFQNDLVVNSNAYKVLLKHTKNKTKKNLKGTDRQPAHSLEPLIHINQTTTSSGEEASNNNSYEEGSNAFIVNQKRRGKNDEGNKIVPKRNACTEKMQYAHCKNDLEMARIYKRYREIKGFERKYQKQNESKIHSEDFERTYYNMKKDILYDKVESYYSYKNISNSCNRTFNNRNIIGKSPETFPLNSSISMRETNGFTPSYNLPVSNTNIRSLCSNRPIASIKKNKYKNPTCLLIKNRSMPNIYL